ncbi:SprT-like family-domain-containing protein [Daldinia decipiens]|uniref:SprT-like family-domain-containing protein n=1 Tax=Daldinia decipiens TaxID=326647 RepID=UPI0020C27AF3|nr:SprT-like family-domain-containing protein [Daldinia decipiens]KAI1659399.1 SprT-like family-domain-containing protein [Daldinia decipiens]
MLEGKLRDSSEDEFPEVDVVVGRFHKVPGKPEVDRKSTQTTTKSNAAVKNAAVKSTPLRRRKLGQGQIVDGSLLKPWDDIATTKGKDSRTSKPRSSRAPIQRANTEPDVPSGDASNQLPATARQTASRTISSSTKPVLLPKEKEIPNQKSRRKDGHEENKQAPPNPKLTKKSIPLDECEEESDTIQEIIDTSEEEISEFVSISESESDTWNSDSEHSLTPPTRRSRSPTTQWAKPQRTLFRDPGKKAAPSNKQPQATIVDPSKHSPKQGEPKKNILDYFKPSQPGNLEDTFQKLHIFNEDSDSDEPSTKAAKKHVLEPTTPKRTQKTLPASPLKTPRIPASPWKPEHKEFWDPEVNFAWIDEHSPEKPQADMSEEATKAKKQAAPKTAKHKPGTSPAKQLRDARRAFDACKENLAQTFLSELDERVTKGQLAQLTRETGGLQITWSNSLLTTAGRAHWKCRTVSTTTRHADGTSSQGATMRQHNASIELASKVLGNEADLLNTVAHEFCHLAVFILGGPNTDPNAERGMGEKKMKAAAHGPEFKAWGARCGAIFGDRGIRVTTKHSYEIEYKYVWRCGDCGSEVKRHSKSVDTERQRCGGCRGRLVQIKPVPRGSSAGATSTPGNSTDAGGTGSGKDSTAATMIPKKKSAWQVFMTKETRVLSQTNPGLSFKERMALISVRWKELQKEEKQKGGGQAAKELQAAVEVLKIDDDDDDDEEEEGKQREVEAGKARGTYDIFA